MRTLHQHHFRLSLPFAMQLCHSPKSKTCWEHRGGLCSSDSRRRRSKQNIPWRQFHMCSSGSCVSDVLFIINCTPHSSNRGVISNSKGGCASLQLVGNFTNYLPLSANGLDSVGFPSVFPLSFQFSSSTSLDHCRDLRDPALALNIIVTFLLFLIFRPKPIVIFWSLLCIGFWHITLFSQPRANPPALDDAFGTFLPALFVGYAFWRLAWRFVLPDFSKMPIEAAVWYIGPFWVGVLANVTFEKIPIDRLTASDLTKRGGAITALVIILIVVIAVIINQARVVRKTGWLPYYLGWYILGGLITLVMALLPGLQYRLHHYIVAIVLMPLTAFSTRLSALYQGLLLGLFLNGVAAFGFDSMLQTAADVRMSPSLLCFSDD